MHTIRQGDVLLLPATLPKGAKRRKTDERADGVVLAYGEVTGHLHAVEEGTTLELYEHDGLVYLRVTGKGAEIRHGSLEGRKVRELPVPEHRALSVPPGVYLVPGQVTWTTERGAARVAD